MLVNGMILMMPGGNAVKIKWEFVFARDVESEAGRYVDEKSVWNFRCPLFLYPSVWQQPSNRFYTVILVSTFRSWYKHNFFQAILTITIWIDLITPQILIVSINHINSPRPVSQMGSVCLLFSFFTILKVSQKDNEHRVAVNTDSWSHSVHIHNIIHKKQLKCCYPQSL